MDKRRDDAIQGLFVVFHLHITVSNLVWKDLAGPSSTRNL
uniref:Uncharacterized protein n=1 Tax=Anguilla anguilla TaxID=7936 RepID=A0A0E9UBW5_ANGAN